MQFNLRTAEAATTFLSEFTSASQSDILLYILNSKNNIEAERFIEEYDIKINDLNIADVSYIASHVTTSNDKLASIKSSGLINLQKVLSEETPLKAFLKHYKIEFDILHESMQIQDTNYNISMRNKNTFDRHSQEYALYSIGHKIYYDFQVSSFFLMEGDTKYGGNVHERPEFLFNLSKICGFDIEREWKRQSHAYIIDFKANFEEFEWFTFYDKDYQYEDDYDSKERLKKWVIQKSLERISNDFFFKSVREIYAYIKPTAVISPDRFLEIREI